MTDVMLVDDSAANVYVRRQDDNPGVTKGWPSSMILVMPNATGPSSRPRRPKGRLDAPLGLVRRETLFALLSAVSAGGVALLCAPAGAVNRCWWTHGRKPKGSTIGLLGCR